VNQSTDRDSLAARIAELETRVAFQEHALTELSDALADARMETARNSEQLVRALADLKQLRTHLYDADPGSEPPPPHY
jgi:SlyX protein